MLKILINYKKSLKNGREELKEYAIGETISKITYLDQLLKMLPLFNEIEKILDNVNPDDLMEPEVKSTKKRQEEKAKIKRE